MGIIKSLEYYKNRNGCFIVFSHCKDKDGYIRIKRNGKLWLLHRWIYEKWYGKIPEGICVCHTCDNPGCINPDHLFLGTQNDNIKDSIKKGRWPDKIGETNGRAILTEYKVREIRKSKSPRKELAIKYSPAKF